jgi:hypothetical protein
MLKRIMKFGLLSLVCFSSLSALTISEKGFIKNENWWYVPPMLFCIGTTIICSVIAYRIEKIYKLDIDRNLIAGNHYCRVLTKNVVCFERFGELWVKEYCGGNDIPEGRTYMVYHCPWCGYQTDKSKAHAKVNFILDQTGDLP